MSVSRKRLGVLGFLVVFFLVLLGLSVEGPWSTSSSLCCPVGGPRSPYSTKTYQKWSVFWYGEEMLEVQTELRWWPNDIHPQLHGWPNPEYGEMPLPTSFRVLAGHDFPYFGYRDWLERRRRCKNP